MRRTSVLGLLGQGSFPGRACRSARLASYAESVDGVRLTHA
ncbi:MULTISPECIES: hypothetical protein [Streptomyces]|jgi:hypothetical protein